MKKNLLYLAFAAVTSLPFTTHSADVKREEEVAKRGSDVMPFNIKTATHVFTKSGDGGTQRVMVKDASDVVQTRLVREHLREIQTQFQRGDFSGPSHIHGNDMPGLAQLKAAKPGKISITYREVGGGAELAYRTSNSKLVSALHEWFDAQLSDHGADAMEGHQRHHGDMPKQ